MLVCKWQRMTLRTVTLSHQISRLGTFKRVALSCGLLAAARKQQGNEYYYAQYIQFQFLRIAFLK